MHPAKYPDAISHVRADPYSFRQMASVGLGARLGPKTDQNMLVPSNMEETSVSCAVLIQDHLRPRTHKPHFIVEL